MQVLGWDGRQRIISLFVSHLKPLKVCISNVEVSLKILHPLKMFGLSKLSEGRQLTGREEVRDSSLSLSSIDEVDNQHFIFLLEIGLVSCWEGLLQRKCQLITSIVTGREDQPTAALENEHFQSKIFSQLRLGLLYD